MRDTVLRPGEGARTARGRRPISDGIVRIGPCMAIPKVLRACGVDPATVVAEAGITLAVFDDADNAIPYATIGRLLASCVRRTGLADFGLRTGADAGIPALGLVGTLVQNSSDVGTALRGFVDHLGVQERGAIPVLRVDDAAVTLAYAILQPGVPATDQIADVALAIGCNVMRTICGPGWAPTAVTFVHPEPSQVAPYREFFGRGVRFGAAENAIVFPPHWLAHPIASANDGVRRSIEQQIRVVGTGEPRGADHMRRVLRMLVNDGEATEERLAHVFAMHRRTINRRLRADGTTFRQLVDEVHFEVARNLLDTTDLPVVRIAASLNYADASAFTRAFRRWSQTTPARWRLARRPKAAASAD